MRNSIKCTLLSALVYPGIGQIVQKNYIRGGALILAVSWSIYQVLVKVLKQAAELFEQLSSSNIAISTDDIFGLVIELMPEVDGPSYKTLMLIILVCWLVSIVDAYIVGRKMDSDEEKRCPDLTDSVEFE